MKNQLSPRVHLYALCLNEAKLIPYFFSHYTDVVDRFVILDNGSTDGSIELLNGDERVSVQSFETTGNSFVDLARRMLDSVWKASRGEADWVIVAEIDEHLYHADLRGYLASCLQTGVTAIRGIGYHMISETFPTAPSPLWQQVVRGQRAPNFDKLAIFRPDALLETNYAPGRHSDAPVGTVVYETQPQVKLLHYKHLGIDYVCERNAMLATGLGSEDLAQKWGSHYLRERAQTEAEMRDILYWSRRVPGLFAEVSGPLDLSIDDELTLLEASGLFDPGHYLAVHADVAQDARYAIAPLSHYCTYGWREGRWPNRHFDPKWYHATYAAFVPLNVNPLLEYLLIGERAGRRPVRYFNPERYRQENRLGLDISPLGHLLATEARESARPG